MPKKINVDKLLKEFSKGTVIQQVDAFNRIRLLLNENLKKQQDELVVLSNAVNSGSITPGTY